MAEEPRNATCDDCGMEFCYSGCERCIYCPGCGQWLDYGRDCHCEDCVGAD